MRTLVLHYSRTGTAEKVAAGLAERLGADGAHIVCAAYNGFVGGLRMFFDTMLRRIPPVGTTTPVEGYDRVIVGGPVWAGRPSPPLRAFLKEHGHDPALAGVFLVHGTADATEAEAEVRRLTSPHVVFAEFRQADVDSDAHTASLQTFGDRFVEGEAELQQLAA